MLLQYFDPDEKWIVDIRAQNDGIEYHPYYLKMYLNLVGKKEDIVAEYRRLPNFKTIGTMTYDIKTKLVLVTSFRGITSPELTMLHMNPYTSISQNEILLLEIPFE